MNKMHRIFRMLIIFLAGVIVGLLAFRFLSERKKQALLSQEQPLSSSGHQVGYGSIPDFSLTDRSGKKINRSHLQGSYWIADFVFTRCMGPCPLLTTNMARIASEFPRQDIKLVSITVDPDFDTPAVLSKYADAYGADKNRWYFLTGNKDEIFSLIRNSFHLAVEPDQKDPMQVVHSLSFVLVGKNGEILGYYNASDPEALDSLREKIKSLT